MTGIEKAIYTLQLKADGTHQSLVFSRRQMVSNMKSLLEKVEKDVDCEMNFTSMIENVEVYLQMCLKHETQYGEQIQAVSTAKWAEKEAAKEEVSCDDCSLFREGIEIVSCENCRIAHRIAQEE